MRVLFLVLALGACAAPAAYPPAIVPTPMPFTLTPGPVPPPSGQPPAVATH